MTEFKYPSTPHLPWSETVGGDDSYLEDYKHFQGKQVVVTEKMDGENTSMYPHMVHARSLTWTRHPTRDWVKAYWASIKNKIPHYHCVMGENLYARHSIKYDCLQSYFYGFAVRDSRLFLSWDDTEAVFKDLGIVSVPVLYKGIWDYHKIKGLSKTLDLNKTEGYVVRLAERFWMDFFDKSVAKYVRPNHVASSKHWLYGGNYEVNTLCKQ